jgi:hypothetical protein
LAKIRGFLKLRLVFAKNIITLFFCEKRRKLAKKSQKIVIIASTPGDDFFPSNFEQLKTSFERLRQTALRTFNDDDELH